MNLVIVESPSKCSKIQGFLGIGWKVLASMGHIRHLVEDLKALHIEDGFKPDYEFMKDKSKTIIQLREAAKNATKIYLASDDDREGEAISYSVALALHLNIKTNPRIVFHEITKSAITKAIQSPRTINMNRVNSQQARAVLDLMIGFTISPLLWRFVGPSLSAGRCQTPALRIIVEREKEIKNFKNQSFWKVSGNWSYKTSKFLGTMTDQLEDEESALNYLENVNTTITAAITNVNTKPTYQNPPLPLITSSLQQEASAIYNSNPKNTMKIAQKLYEAGHITYMRTDSTILSEEAIVEAQKL
jgi:DNA topoisomerase-1